MMCFLKKVINLLHPSRRNEEYENRGIVFIAKTAFFLEIIETMR